ncbi:hypothetical protein AFLA_005625 [Aspergillus flavus NRRL3357]|nr:hypothetical protein AFLA_005625 [Aspergillus flavus NRRL3357]
MIRRSIYIPYRVCYKRIDWKGEPRRCLKNQAILYSVLRVWFAFIHARPVHGLPSVWSKLGSPDSTLWRLSVAQEADSSTTTKSIDHSLGKLKWTHA